MKKYQNKEWLEEQYTNQKKSMQNIAKCCKVNIVTILNWLRKLNIPTRNHSEAGKLMENNKGCFKKGNQNWLGKHHTEESKKKMSRSQKARKINHKNKRNPIWKGDKVGYKALHIWVNRYKKRTHLCTICNEYHKRTVFANIDHIYVRKIDDYIELCSSCHWLYDKLKGFINAKN